MVRRIDMIEDVATVLYLAIGSLRPLYVAATAHIGIPEMVSLFPVLHFHIQIVARVCSEADSHGISTVAMRALQASVHAAISTAS